MPPPLLCASAAVEFNAVVKAKNPAITKAFLIFISRVGAKEGASRETNVTSNRSVHRRRFSSEIPRRTVNYASN
jgi:hypothetical protein